MRKSGTQGPTSSFAPLEPAAAPAPAGWRSSLAGAAEGLAFTLPISLGSVTVVFSHVGRDLQPAGIFALLLAMAWIHLTTALEQRPLLYGARFFEATTLAAMMAQMVESIPAWGLPDTGGVRLALLCLVGASAGIVVGLLYLLRADRFTRLIPSPVFAGFSNSIAVALLVSQSQTLWRLVAEAPTVAPVASIGLAVLCVAIALRYWRPRWPASTIALAAGLGMGLLWANAGHATAVIGEFGWGSVLPVTLADFGALSGPQARTWPIAGALVSNAAILGTMIFINTTMAAEFMAQADGRRSQRGAAALAPVSGIVLAGCIGSIPLSGSMNASAIAAGKAAMSPLLMLCCALLIAGVYFTGVIGLVPLAAVCAVLLCEAWFMADRGSLRQLRAWLLKRPLVANGREDLALVATVTATAVFLNMVAAVFVGLLLGLVLFAARNASRPVRNQWTGAQLTSNCARSRTELRLLAEHGAGIHVIELDGDLFFGAIDSLERSLEPSLVGATSLVIDWSRVRHIDTSVVRCFAHFERRAASRGIVPIHAACGALDGELSATLSQHLPAMRTAPDLDRALEQAENDVILARGRPGPPDAAVVLESAALFVGMDDAERALLERAMEQKVYRAGEVIMRAGEPGDELMLVLQGSANVMLASPGNADIRVAGVRRGATVGDIAFLDQSRRSATVVAEEDTRVAVLRRETYDELCTTQPRLVQRLLSNLALNLAVRLRHTNHLAVQRHTR